MDGAIRTVDLSVDAGEIATREGKAVDAEMIGLASTAHIAAGGHAGDLESMRRTIDLCRDAGVVIGAHPSYPDRPGFGRRPSELGITQVVDSVLEQISELDDLARVAGANVVSVKPHGQLYHDLEADRELADAFFSALGAHGAVRRVVLRCGTSCGPVARSHGVALVAEGFCDRRYVDGALVSRDSGRAVLDERGEVANQAVELAIRGLVIEQVRHPVESLCLHSDTEGAAALMRAVRGSLEACGLTIGAPEP
jgi:UPF0271 protein